MLLFLLFVLFFFHVIVFEERFHSDVDLICHFFDKIIRLFGLNGSLLIFHLFLYQLVGKQQCSNCL